MFYGFQGLISYPLPFTLAVMQSLEKYLALSSEVKLNFKRFQLKDFWRVIRYYSKTDVILLRYSECDVTLSSCKICNRHY